MNIEQFISEAVRRSVEALYGAAEGEQLQIQKTRREFEGDYTLVVFPLLRRSRKHEKNRGNSWINKKDI